MSYESILAELTEGLQAAGRENFNVSSSDEAMANLAEPIAKAIHEGSDFEIKGSATVAEIGAMQDMQPGDIWAMKDGGTIYNPDGTTLAVTAGDLIRWDGEKWSTLLHIDLSGYVTDEQLAAAIASISAAVAAVQASISAHANRTDNPHQVTASQVGAATASDISSAIAAHNTSGSAHNDIRERIDQIPIIEVDPDLDPGSANPVENQAVTNAMNGKQDQLIEMTDQEVEDLIDSLE